MIKRLDEYNTKREKFKEQRESTLLNAKDFYKGGTIILIAFQNGTFPLLKQYSSGMNDWEEDELYSPYILPNEASILLPSVEIEKKTEKI